MSPNFSHLATFLLGEQHYPQCPFLSNIITHTFVSPQNVKAAE
jgi:hypothetical protein